MNEMPNEEKIVYRLMEYSFLKANGREVGADPKANEDLFPPEWYSFDNYVLKAEILGEAIEKKIPIINTEGYQKVQEGIKNIK